MCPCTRDQCLSFPTKQNKKWHQVLSVSLVYINSLVYTVCNVKYLCTVVVRGSFSLCSFPPRKHKSKHDLQDWSCHSVLFVFIYNVPKFSFCVFGSNKHRQYWLLRVLGSLVSSWVIFIISRRVEDQYSTFGGFDNCTDIKPLLVIVFYNEIFIVNVNLLFMFNDFYLGCFLHVPQVSLLFENNHSLLLSFGFTSFFYITVSLTVRKGLIRYFSYVKVIFGVNFFKLFG